MKKVKLLLSMILVLSMCFIISTSCFAAASPPSGTAPICDLSKGAYNYQVNSIGYRVYTDSWLTGESSYNISVYGWTCIVPNGPPNYNSLTIYVYNTLGTIVSATTIDPTKTSVATLTGMSAGNHYYVCFQVPTNNNIWSFNGSIQ